MRFFKYIQKTDVSLGQRTELSEKDVMKLNRMYNESCDGEIQTRSGVETVDRWIQILDFIEDMFGY